MIQTDIFFHHLTLRKFKAFFGTSRTQMKEIRECIRIEHQIDIGNPLAEAKQCSQNTSEIL